MGAYSRVPLPLVTFQLGMFVPNAKSSQDMEEDIKKDAGD